MKVSEFLREYQVTGLVPTADDPNVSFWAGWILGCARGSRTVTTLPEALDMAARAAEFIESKARE